MSDYIDYSEPLLKVKALIRTQVDVAGGVTVLAGDVLVLDGHACVDGVDDRVQLFRSHEDFSA